MLDAEVKRTLVIDAGEDPAVFLLWAFDNRREVFQALLAQQPRRPNWPHLTRCLLATNDEACLADLLDFANNRSRGCKLLQAFLETSVPEDHAWANCHPDFSNLSHGTAYKFVRFLNRLGRREAQEWIACLRNDPHHWTLTLPVEISLNMWWYEHVQQWLDHRQPDVRRAYEALCQAVKDFRADRALSEEEQRLRHTFAGHLYHTQETGIDDSTLRDLVRSVFHWHVSRAGLNKDLSPHSHLGMIDQRHGMVYRCGGDGAPVAVRQRLTLPNRDLIRRLCKRNPQGRVVEVTQEAAMMRALSCHYHEENLCRSREKFVSKHGQPSETSMPAVSMGS